MESYTTEVMALWQSFTENFMTLKLVDFSGKATLWPHSLMPQRLALVSGKCKLCLVWF